MTEAGHSSCSRLTGRCILPSAVHGVVASKWGEEVGRERFDEREEVANDDRQECDLERTNRWHGLGTVRCATSRSDRSEDG